MPLHVVLVEPEIPQNTGNIARTCAAVGACLHLVQPLGFSLDDKYMKRAGLDYWDLVDVSVHDSFDAFFSTLSDKPFVLVTKKTSRLYSDMQYPRDCFLIFGKETYGLPEPLLKKFPDRCVRIPMREEARSLNLSNAAALLVYEALRQQNFPGLI